jgi:hypothetical protein
VAEAAAVLPAVAVPLPAPALTVNYTHSLSERATLARARRKTHVDHVVERAVLRDGDEHRLVVRGRVDRGDAVEALGEAASDVRGEDAVLGGVVEALEEREAGRVRRRRLVGRLELLDDDVRVALDVPLRVHLLRRGKVVRVRVHEVARLEVRDGERDGEGRVGRERRAVRRELELGRRHVLRRRDDAHRRGVARARLDLLAVREREAGHRQAEVDEVVRRGQRRDLARFGSGGM